MFLSPDGWFLLANVIRTLDDNFAPDTDAWNSYFSRGGQCMAKRIFSIQASKPAMTGWVRKSIHPSVS
jgi:hypothetical protein